MRKALFIALIAIAFSSAGQTDQTATIKVSLNRPFPQIGLDLKNRKWFVMSTTQDRAALIALEQGLIMDSLLSKYEALQESNEKIVGLLNGRISDKDEIIAEKTAKNTELEEKYAFQTKQLSNCEASGKDKDTKIGRLARSKWGGYVVAAFFGTLLILK